MGHGNRWSPISPTGSAVCIRREAKHPLSRASGVILVLCVLHSILQLPKQNTSCLVVTWQGTVCIMPWVSREDLLPVCAHAHCFFFPFFFFPPPRGCLKLTLVIVGRNHGTVPWHVQGKARQSPECLQRAFMPAHACRATGTDRSEQQPPLFATSLV